MKGRLMDTDKIKTTRLEKPGLLHFCRSFISVVSSSWYDETDKEFEDKLDEVVLENAKIIALTGNNAFSVKKLLSVDQI